MHTRWGTKGAVAVAAVVMASAAGVAAQGRGGDHRFARRAAGGGTASSRAVAVDFRAGSDTWCGTDESAADRKPDLEVSSASQIHVVYAVPTDRPDRFGSLASPIAGDIADVAAWWQREDASRVPRFDLFAFPGCTSRFAMLDLGVIRLRQDTFAYRGQAGWRTLVTEVAAATRQPTKTLVYYDGPEGGTACGRAYSWVGVVYLEVPSGCGSGVGIGGELAVTAAHELAHTLGAVPSQAPNVCPTSPSHVGDNSGDLMDPLARRAGQ